MAKRLELAGHKFGRLHVERLFGLDRFGRTTWLCQCECGTKRVVMGSVLYRGHTKSCGCYSRDTARTSHTTHGMSAHPLYWVWAAMIARCTNSKVKHYQNYGGRGISVCKKWMSSSTFLRWAITQGWKKGLSLERRNNDGDYKPSNCYWATNRQQSRNQRSNVTVSFNGETMIASDWADRFGVKLPTLLYRLKRGWPLEEAFGIKKRADKFNSHLNRNRKQKRER